MTRRIGIALIVLLAVASSNAWSQTIFDAVKKGDAAAVTALLANDASQIKARDRYTLTPLHWAVLEGNRDMVERLVAAGADMNARNRLNATPLDVARLHRQDEIVRWLLGHGADPTPGRWPAVEGDYVGEKTPDSAAKLFSPLMVSSVVAEHGAPVFTPDGREVFWAVTFDDPSQGEILSMKRVGTTWSEVRPVAFSQPRVRDVSPVLSADGNRLYFQSCRPVATARATPEYNIWFADRAGDGWAEPHLLDASISSGKDGRPLVTKDGTLYFVSWRDGVNRIYRSALVNGRYGAPEKLDAPFNDDVIPAWVSDDQARIIFESTRPGGLGKTDFWVSVRDGNGRWQEPANLGPGINSEADEAFGSFSPDGKYFFFGSNRDGNADVYWVSAPALLSGVQKDTPAPRKIADRLYTITGAGATVTVLVAEGAVLTVDSGVNPDDGAAIVRGIRGVSQAPIRYVVYTHYHPDHVGGAAAFPSTTTVISHASTRRMLPSLEQITKRTFVSPQVTFDSELTLHVGGEEIRLLYLGPGHTGGDVMVYFPRQRVLHIGDLLFTNGWVPRLDADAGASVDNWLKIFDAIAAMDVERIVPGHGEIVDKAGFLRISAVARAYLTDLQAEVARLMDRKLSLEEIKKTLRFPKYAHMELAEMLLPYNIDGVYRELDAKRKRTTHRAIPNARIPSAAPITGD